MAVGDIRLVKELKEKLLELKPCIAEEEFEKLNAMLNRLEKMEDDAGQLTSPCLPFKVHPSPKEEKEGRDLLISFNELLDQIDKTDTSLCDKKEILSLTNSMRNIIHKL